MVNDGALLYQVPVYILSRDDLSTNGLKSAFAMFSVVCPFAVIVSFDFIIVCQLTISVSLAIDIVAAVFVTVLPSHCSLAMHYTVYQFA